MFSSEVLPAPFGPMIEAIAPRWTEIETSSTARTPPNRFDTLRTSSRHVGCRIRGIEFAGRALTVAAMPSGFLPRPAAYAAAVMAAMMMARFGECNRRMRVDGARRDAAGRPTIVPRSLSTAQSGRALAAAAPA